jgi:bifunctional UDP-N-acetylglucosamine pyrophosphorylase/glucosamine-1-phosphate N-acetyltransferase
MDAVILAAGKGLRMRPLTETTPKPLLHLQGRPILDWTLGALPPTVDRVLVVVYYLAEQIEAYLRTQHHFRDWVAVSQGEARGTGDAFRSCRPHLRSERFLVMNGDDLYGAADLAELAASEAGVLCQTVDDPEKWGIAICKADGSLEKLVEKPKGLPAPQLANAGAYVFPREVFDVELKLSERGDTRSITSRRWQPSVGAGRAARSGCRSARRRRWRRPDDGPGSVLTRPVVDGHAQSGAGAIHRRGADPVPLRKSLWRRQRGDTIAIVEVRLTLRSRHGQQFLRSSIRPRSLHRGLQLGCLLGCSR